MKKANLLFPLVSSAFLIFSEPAHAATGDLFVQANKDGLKIYVDGVDTGQVTPSMVEGIQDGSHEIQVKGTCFEGMRTANIDADRITRINLTATKTFGQLKVTTRPEGAEIYIDRRYAGTGPMTTKPLSCEEHTVTASAPGYQESSTTLMVPGSDTIPLELRLNPEPVGALAINIEPYTATVWVDGEQVSVGPLTIEPISVGNHVIMATAEGLQSQTVEVMVKAPGVTRIDLNLNEQSVTTQNLKGSTEDVEEEEEEEEEERKEESANSYGGSPLYAAKEEAPQDRADTDSVSSIPTHIVLGASLTGIGSASLIYATTRYLSASEAYERYLDPNKSDQVADMIYNEEVQPARKQALIAGGVGVLAVAGGVVSFIDDRAYLTLTARGMTLTSQF